MGKNSGPYCGACLVLGIRAIGMYTRFCFGCGIHLCIGHWHYVERQKNLFDVERTKIDFQNSRCDLCHDRIWDTQEKE